MFTMLLMVIKNMSVVGLPTLPKGINTGQGVAEHLIEDMNGANEGTHRDVVPHMQKQDRHQDLQFDSQARENEKVPNHKDESSSSAHEDKDTLPSEEITASSVKKEEDVEIPDTVGNFDRVIEPFKMDSAPIKVAKWKSRETGLSVVWADIDGPIVNGYLTVATEIFNDSGVPHTLEHLIFMGSEKYPYKGILASLANRSFATGINAWTETTHTAYTVKTAGSEGFFKLLPSMQFHPIYKFRTANSMKNLSLSTEQSTSTTIPSSAFTTEVYHINGEGEDAGVVYSEMQGRENSSTDLMSLRSLREIYPPTSAYQSETSGKMAALRTLTVEQIRKYHSDYYHPHNLQLLVTGKVDPTTLLSVLQEEVEPSLIKHGQDKFPAEWKRPFLETASKGGAVLTKDKVVEVPFPEKDESTGQVQISWVGPSINDYLLQDALKILETYLTKTAISPLAKKFIDIEDPLCTGITFYPTEGEKTVISACISSVPAEHLSDFGKMFKDALAHEAENLDMQRMRMTIECDALEIANQLEANAHSILSSAIISNFLYGSGEQLVADLSTVLERYKTLASWSREQWSSMFKKWLVESPSVTVIGKPSGKLADQLVADNKARIEETKKKYGPEGLKQLQAKLEAAQKTNDTPHPQTILSNYPIPKMESIKWIEVESARADGSLKGDLQAQIDKKDSTILPYFIQFDHIDSNFLRISVHLSPTDLPADLVKYLYIWLALFFSLPVKRSDGTLLPFDQVVKELTKETIEYKTHMGSSISQTSEICFKIEKSKYPTMIGWLKDLLWGSQFDIDRLRIIVANNLQHIPSMKRSGAGVCAALFQELLYSPYTAPYMSSNLFKLDEWLPEIMEQLKSNPQEVIKNLEQLRKHCRSSPISSHTLTVLQPSTMRLSVVGDIKTLQDPKKSWLEHFQKIPSSTLRPPLYSSDVLSADGLKPSGKAIVMSMPSIESSFAYHVAKGAQGFNHPDRPALAVAVSLLNSMESHLWKAIRGTGLAYGASMRSIPESGHVCVQIYSSPDSWKAFEEAGKVMSDLISKKLILDELSLEAAKSSLAYATAELESTMGSAAFSTFTNMALKGIEKDASRQLLDKTKDITIDQVLEVIEKYFLPIFDAQTSVAVVTSSPGKAKSTAASLRNAGYRVEERDLNVASQ
ncbi:zinc metalloprotease [Melampsora larici-populina 98AG31]|uniref:Zinc metalloprotease n=1 Tax=Melampsora larici-populina (strain 98AG31 / pathotype 3-4-7) TaxID=747676 RepID=F4S789_MELLP|nr:zinc metalloprotease [Melampsora larici-populina 98AG31]EGF99472.1 zinc metalloprotease [Melampsora larici-populina 98AG31]